MKPRFFLPALGLVVVLLAVSCTPAVPLAPASASVPATAAQTDSSAPAIQAVATSRGPNLEATDPATVSLASDQLQLVEFFRFT
jgi:hypothetical protein